jgi:cytochrome c oxidase subunit 2
MNRRSLNSTLSRLAGGLVTTLATSGLFAAPVPNGPERYAGKYWLPPIASVEGQEIDWMFNVIYYLTMTVMVGVFLVMIYFLIRYRERPGVKQTAIYSHGNNTVELIWTIIPAIILVVIAFMSEQRWSDLKKEPPAKGAANEYRIEAYTFAWDVFYPGEDGVLGTDDDFKLPTLHLEQGKPAMITLTSRDVIHSFFLPDFRIKQDAMPGRVVDVWFTPTKTGRYQIACAEFCGNGHTNMKGNLEVHTVEKFQEVMAKEIELFNLYGGM